MVFNYLKIALRNLGKHKLFSLINIISLAIGLSASFVIGLMVYYDLTFDKSHKDGDLIYRVTTKFQTPDGVFRNPGVSIPLKTSLKEGMIGVDVATSIYTAEFLKINISDTKKEFKKPDKAVFTDPEFFKVFDYHWIAGNKNDVLKNPGEVVLTKSRAEKYFPNTPINDVLGKTLVYNDSVPVNVVGIVVDFM